jgi:hypothetical protein
MKKVHLKIIIMKKKKNQDYWEIIKMHLTSKKCIF